jgi:hypothetical protein
MINVYQLKKLLEDVPDDCLISDLEGFALDQVLVERYNEEVGEFVACGNADAHNIALVFEKED